MIPIHAISVVRTMSRSALLLPACTQQYRIFNKPIVQKEKCSNKQTRRFSVNSINMADPRRVVSFNDISKYTQQKDKLIIDVRNPDEVASTGKIPSSINIPLNNVEPALSLSTEQFQQQFQVTKPDSTKELIFYCKSGKRASQATDTALKLGYSNSKTYVGSWDEWSSKMGQN